MTNGLLRLLLTIVAALAGWRETDGREIEADEHGTNRLTLVLPPPTKEGTAKSKLTAYAFNKDRVKSATASSNYARPPVALRKPRAFVINIGIDAYDEERLALNYAVSDAKLLSNRLASIPGYEVRRATLIGAKLPGESEQRITRDAMHAVFAVLAGFGDDAETKSTLRGIDVDQLERVMPDDIVILSFSGHGWASPQGDFYLLPVEGKWAADAQYPELSTLVSSRELTKWLGNINASEIAVIIDACHSGASVNDGSFKPSQMGEVGLGHLAYNKGIRVLAATQANDVAFESSLFRHGLLTQALSEGMGQEIRSADANRDGKLMLDEWLHHAVARVKILSSRMNGANLNYSFRGFTFRNRRPFDNMKIQVPVLFDYNLTKSDVVLKTWPQ